MHRNLSTARSHQQRSHPYFGSHSGGRQPPSATNQPQSSSNHPKSSSRATRNNQYQPELSTPDAQSGSAGYYGSGHNDFSGNMYPEQTGFNQSTPAQIDLTDPRSPIPNDCNMRRTYGFQEQEYANYEEPEYSYREPVYTARNSGYP